MKYACLLVAALLIVGCGGGTENTATPAPPPPKKSRLIAFEAGDLDDGLKLPDFTNYWTQAETRNGNSYPVKASATDESVIVLRLDAKGDFAVHTTKWTVESLPTIARKMDTLGKKFWNSEKEASAAAIILFADATAPYTQLLKLCRSLVDLQVRNLWLVTHDTRDDSARLLPLKVDTDQLFREWYHLTEEEQSVTARLLWTRHDGRNQVILRGATRLLDPGKFEAWKELIPEMAKRDFPDPSRVQFRLPDDGTINEFAEAANALATLGFNDVEPYWPVLNKPDGSETVKEKRTLFEYLDEIEHVASMDVPTLNEYWRAVAAGDRLPAPVKIDADSPVLALRVAGDGMLSTRARDEPVWTIHADDLEFIQALQRNAGEVDFDTGASTLQLVMCMDRNATWKTFLEILEMMMLSSAVHRLLVVTNDVIGPTLRLLDLSLPLGDLASDAKIAAVDLAREGIVADAKYTLKFTLDGETQEYSGARFASSLTIWSGERKADPDVLLIKLPRDEPFETLFTVLNGAAWLGMKGIRIGG